MSTPIALGDIRTDGAAPPRVRARDVAPEPPAWLAADDDAPVPEPDELDVEHFDDLGAEPGPEPSPRAATATPIGLDTPRKNASAEWPDPRPLSRQDQIAPLPIDALPSWWRAWVEAEAASVQVAPEMAFGFSLGALAAIAGGRVWVQGKDDWTEGVNLFVAIVAEPGERKSPVQAHATAPIVAYEASLIAAARERVEAARAHRDLLENNVERAKSAHQRAKPEGRAGLAEEYARLRAELADTPAPVEPRLIAGDVTPERLIEMLAEQGGRLAVLPDEDAMIGHLSGRYSRSPAIEPFLSAYSGRAINVDRRGRTVRCARPALTISTPIQPGLFAAASGTAAIKDRGLLDRFIVLVPGSTIGYREIDTPAVPQDVRARYRDAMLSIAHAVEGADVTITLAADARAAFGAWHAGHERELAGTGRLAPIRSWSAKSEGRCLRLAALLHLAENEGRNLSNPVSLLAVSRATALMAALADHALAAADLLGADHLLGLARDVARWLVEGHLAATTTRDVQRAFRARCPKSTDAHSVLRRLADHCFVRKAPPAKGPGRKAEKWLVSPRIGEILSVLSTVRSKPPEVSLSLSLPVAPLLYGTTDKTDRTSAAFEVGHPPTPRKPHPATPALDARPPAAPPRKYGPR